MFVAASGPARWQHSERTDRSSLACPHNKPRSYTKLPGGREWGLIRRQLHGSVQHATQPAHMIAETSVRSSDLPEILVDDVSDLERACTRFRGKSYLQGAMRDGRVRGKWSRTATSKCEGVSSVLPARHGRSAFGDRVLRETANRRLPSGILLRTLKISRKAGSRVRRSIRAIGLERCAENRSFAARRSRARSSAGHCRASFRELV
jgi:hypothetical protein